MDLIVGALQFDFSIHAPCEGSDSKNTQPACAILAKFV